MAAFSKIRIGRRHPLLLVYRSLASFLKGSPGNTTREASTLRFLRSRSRQTRGQPKLGSSLPRWLMARGFLERKRRIATAWIKFFLRDTQMCVSDTPRDLRTGRDITGTSRSSRCFFRVPPRTLALGLICLRFSAGISLCLYPPLQ